MDDGKPISITAKWVLSVAGPPIEGGVVTIAGERIVSVDRHRAGKIDRDFGDAAILPGLVNAHTHFDLTGASSLPRPSPSESFPDWLLRVIAFRRSRTAQQVEADIRHGLDESLRAGVTLLGDISATGASWPHLNEAELQAVVFREWIGLSAERGDAASKEAIAWVNVVKPSDRSLPGLSPHATYSANTRSWGTGGRIPRCLHAFESREELELLQSGTGPFVPFLKSVGAYAQDEIPSLDAAFEAIDSAAPILIAHGNFAPPDRLGPGHSVVYCPRTHAAFGHPPHPFREFLNRGVNVCLGTDSLASNPDLDVLEEARFLASKYPEFTGTTLIEMLTANGHRALGFAGGTLVAGGFADLVVVPVEAANDPFAALFHRPLPNATRSTMFRGRWRSPSRSDTGISS